MQESFSWYVILPERKPGFGAGHAKASLAMCAGEAGTEYISVPVFVARTLGKAKKTGEADPHDRAALLRLVEETSTRCAQQRVVKLLERRDYSAKEVYEKLVQDGFRASLAQQAVRDAKTKKIINDIRYAESFVRSKVSAGWGMRRITHELDRRGVNVRELEGWPYDYLDPEDEYGRAMEVASRKRVSEPNAYAKLVRFLAHRGFSYDVASRAAKATLDGRECS